MPVLFLNCVASWYHILSTQGLRSREEEDKVWSYFLLKVRYYVSLDALHLYILSGNIDQVEHHKFITNKYEQQILIMWSYQDCPKTYDNWSSFSKIVLILRVHHVVGNSRYLQSFCNHSVRHSRTWNSRRKHGAIWWRSRASASYWWASLHESL